jgi:hypothetical protein
MPLHLIALHGAVALVRMDFINVSIAEAKGIVIIRVTMNIAQQAHQIIIVINVHHNVLVVDQ